MRARPGLEGRRGCGRPVGWAWSWRWCLLFCCGDENKPGVEEAEASLAQGEVPAAGRCGCDRWSASTSASLDEGAGWGGVPPPLGRAGRGSASWFGHLSSGRVWAHHAELPGEGGWCPRGDGPGNHIPHQHLRGLSHRQSSEETSRLWQSQLLAVAHSDRVPLLGVDMESALGRRCLGGFYSPSQADTLYFPPSPSRAQSACAPHSAGPCPGRGSGGRAGLSHALWTVEGCPEQRSLCLLLL